MLYATIFKRVLDIVRNNICHLKGENKWEIPGVNYTRDKNLFDCEKSVIKVGLFIQFKPQVAKALVMTENQHSAKLTVLLCLYLTYLLFGVKVRSPSENVSLIYPPSEYYSYER